MRNLLNKIFFLFLLSFSNIYSQYSDAKIGKEYNRIENLKKLKTDSLSCKRGIDFSRGSNVDEKKYKIFNQGKRIIKIEYEERNDGYRKWQKTTTIYLKNDIPFFVIEKTEGTMTLYTSNGEKAEPFKNLEEIYINDWKSEKYKTIYNGYLQKPQMKICKICYDELIEEIKNKFKPKR